MIPRLAILPLILGLCIGGYFLRRGPMVSTPSVELRWSSALDAGGVDVSFTHGGVDFLQARDADEPRRSFAVLRKGEQFICIDDFNFFHAVQEHDGRLWAVGESETEGPGPSIDLLLSSDQGRTFELRASVPKPNYQASFERFEVEGDELTLLLSIDDETPLSDEWVWPWWALDFASVSRPTVGPGRFILRSKNDGRSWRLER